MRDFVKTLPCAGVTFPEGSRLVFRHSINPRSRWRKSNKAMIMGGLGSRHKTDCLEPETRLYLKVNDTAIAAEAATEIQVLAKCVVRAYNHGEVVILAIWPQEDRPFRVYAGELIVLIGKDMFSRSRALSHDKECPGYFAKILTSASIWKLVRDAPYHAVLQSPVQQTAIDQLLAMFVEYDVQIVPAGNPATPIWA
ncbi:hypothetical protein BJX68DRAFT_262780 [Aspergillus pseudodeflectus]|uniref:Uncharacterized protein n=1 Tax=Aspergillus pseudodeflectus TaxID=176178 RepID=A0ABR4L138_9EURO